MKFPGLLPYQLIDGGNWGQGMLNDSPVGFVHISSGFGNKEEFRTIQHEGLDLVKPGAGEILGEAIYSLPYPGKVELAGYDASRGNHVSVWHEFPGFEGEPFQFYYLHMRDTPMVQPGQSISPSQQLGVVGSTGNSNGPHLHWAVTHGPTGVPLNPMAFFKREFTKETLIMYIANGGSYYDEGQPDNYEGMNKVSIMLPFRMRGPIRLG